MQTRRDLPATALLASGKVLVTFDAVMEPSQLAGTLDFSADAATLCANVSLSAGSASCNSSALPVQDALTLSAHYAGDAHYAPATATAPIVVRVLSAGDVVYRDDFELGAVGC